MSDAPRLWDWALQAYERKGAKAALLAAQDMHGADVCLLLWLVWRETRAAPAGAGELESAKTLSARFQAPLSAEIRAVRRALKTADVAGRDDMVERLKRAELAAEHAQLDALEAIDAADVSAHGRGDMLASYLQERGLSADAAKSLSDILRAALTL